MRPIIVNVDEAVLEDLVPVLGRLQLPLELAIELFLDNVATYKQLPFEVVSRIPTEETLQALAEADEALKHPELNKSYASADEITWEVLGGQ